MKLAPKIMNGVFNFIECWYPLRNELRFKSRNICTVSYGTETATFVGSKIWTNKPDKLKESKSLNEFKSKIKAVHANSVKSTFRELVTFKLLISICSKMLLFVLLLFVCLFFLFFLFVFFFLLFLFIYLFIYSFIFVSFVCLFFYSSLILKLT